MFRKLRSSSAACPNRTNANGRRLSLEAMEERRLMAADAYLGVVDGVDTLIVEGTNARDVVKFDYSGANLLRVSVKDQWGKYQRNDADEEVHKTFDRDDFDRIKVDVYNGRDDVTNNTSVPMIANGGGGDDWLSGGSGPDHLIGGSNVDKLFGNDGDDLLEGGPHTDYLYGGDDDDVLFGDSGNDWLYGQGDNDGMYGGLDRDRIYTGSGRDRVLRDEGTTDYVYNESSDDAVIWFKNSNTTTRTVDGETKTYSGAAWNPEEIKAVDKALAILHAETDNTRLLKSSYNAPVTFHRVGSPSSGQSEEGWSDHVGNIRITDAAFDEGMPLTQTVIHEIGHNWDWEGANNTIDQFRALSGWMDTNIIASYWRRGGGRTIVINPYATEGRDIGDGWWYDVRNTNFVREYSRENPYEDFATSFAAYILGSDFYVGTVAEGQTVGGAAAAPEKMAYMEQFVGGF